MKLLIVVLLIWAEKEIIFVKGVCNFSGFGFWISYRSSFVGFF